MFKGDDLERKIFRESNYWNGQSHQTDSKTKTDNITTRKFKPPPSPKTESKLSNPFRRRRSNLQNMLYQGLLISPIDEVNSPIEAAKKRESTVSPPASPEQTITQRLDRIEDILLYLACRLRNQELMENVKQEWRFLAEVIDRILVIAFLICSFVCTYLLLAGAKDGGEAKAQELARELEREALGLDL